MISVCIITKNEKEKLNRNLQSLSSYDLEVVVVDTGSTDGTTEMLEEWKSNNDKKFSLVCGEFAWCNDFSKARNYSISLASNDKILVLDSDEMILKMNLSKLEKLMDKNSMKMGRLCINDKLEQNGIESFRKSYLCRLFDRRYFHYTGRIHEQVTPINKIENTLSELYYRTEIEILHDGYYGDEEHHLAKSKRNIELLQAELDEHGDDPYILYHLGKSYYRMKDYKIASEIFAKALSFDLDPRLEYVIDMVEAYGYTLINSKQADVALGLESVYDEFGNTAEFRLMMGHVYMHNCMFDRAIESFLSATKCKTSATEGMNSYLAYYNAGVIYEVLGQKDKAIDLYKKCGQYKPAITRLQTLKG